MKQRKDELINLKNQMARRILCFQCPSTTLRWQRPYRIYSKRWCNSSKNNNTIQSVIRSKR